jgi:hypothetical protein
VVRELGDPRANELVECLRDRQRLNGIKIVRQGADELEREERVSTRPLMDSEQSLTWERPGQPVAEELVERADAEGPDLHMLDVLFGQRLL